MSETTSLAQHHIVGGGIAGLATAVYLIRDAGVGGENIHIYEQLGVAGGSLDGSGDAESGYMIRGGRMFEEHFACTFDLLDTLPSANDPNLSVTEDIMAFNRMVPGSSTVASFGTADRTPTAMTSHLLRMILSISTV